MYKRQRYVGRVAAKAKGQSQDTMSELENFELGRGNRLGQDATEAQDKEISSARYTSREAAEKAISDQKIGATHHVTGVSHGQGNRHNKNRYKIIRTSTSNLSNSATSGAGTQNRKTSRP